MKTKTRMTAAEFYRTGPETDGYELVRGELERMPPPGDAHGKICANGVYLLTSYVKRLGHGSVVCNDAGIVTHLDPDTVRGMDVAVFLRPDWQAPLGYTEEPPDLVIEVRSPEQGWPKVVNKVDDYLSMGVRLVWVINPEKQQVSCFSQEQEPTILAVDEELDGGTVLPGFRCLVAELFEGVNPPVPPKPRRRKGKK